MKAQGREKKKRQGQADRIGTHSLLSAAVAAKKEMPQHGYSLGYKAYIPGRLQDGCTMQGTKESHML